MTAVGLDARRRASRLLVGRLFIPLTTCLAVLVGLVPSGASRADPRQVPIADLELSGISPGGTTDEIREALGEPERISIVKTTTDDFPHFEYHFDGLRLVLSMHGRTLLNYFVTSSRYRLRSGVGIGSSREEIEAALGPAIYARTGDDRLMIYLATGADGRPIPVQLTITLNGDVASEFSLVSR